MQIWAEQLGDQSSAGSSSSVSRHVDESTNMILKARLYALKVYIAPTTARKLVCFRSAACFTLQLAPDVNQCRHLLCTKEFRTGKCKVF
jgi:hypothetical protein